MDSMNEVPTIGVVIIDNGKVLLVQKKKHQGRGWQVPGGEIEQGETLEQAAVRELQETTGLQAAGDSLQVLEQTWHASLIKAGGTQGKYSLRVVVCDNYTGTLSETETATPKWVPLSELPDMTLAPNTEEIVQAAQAK